MKRLWERIVERIDAATLRERAFIFAALVVLLVTLVDALLIGAEFDTQKRLSREIAQRRTESAALQVQLGKMVQVQQADPDRANRERLAQLQSRIAEAEARIGEQQRKFTAPAQMGAVLEEMLSRNSKVLLVEMKTLAPGTLAEPGAQAETQAAKPAAAKPAAKPQTPAEGRIFRHGVELTVAGSYLDLLAYVTDLEGLRTQLYWGGAELSAAKYPLLTLKLNVFTLSLDKAWMNV